MIARKAAKLVYISGETNSFYNFSEQSIKLHQLVAVHIRLRFLSFIFFYS